MEGVWITLGALAVAVMLDIWCMYRMIRKIEGWEQRFTELEQTVFKPANKPMTEKPRSRTMWDAPDPHGS